MNWRITLSFAAVCLALVGILYKGFGRNPHEVPFMLKGQKAPLFTLMSLNTGERVNLADFQGQPVVLNFWASWCGPCEMEHPVLEWGARNFGHQARYLGVVFEDTDENARRFLMSRGSSFPQLSDPRSRMAVDYGVAGVPETYFIDRQGTIRGKHVGPIDQGTLVAWMKDLSAETPTATPSAGD